jgi:hypothetical protein
MKVLESIGRAKYTPEKEREVHFAEIFSQMDSEFLAMTEGEKDDA